MKTETLKIFNYLIIIFVLIVLQSCVNKGEENPLLKPPIISTEGQNSIDS